MNCGLSEIQKKFDEILHNKFADKCDFAEIERRDKEMLGSYIQFTPTELLCLFFEVEKEFNIVICEEYIVQGRFNTYNNICSVICDTLNSNKELLGFLDC